MTDTPRHQRDLFETPAPPKSIPSNAQAPMLELLEALLTEALAGDNAGCSAAGSVVVTIASFVLISDSLLGFRRRGHNRRSVSPLRCS